MWSAAERRVRDSRRGWWRWWSVHVPVAVVMAVSVPHCRVRATSDAHAAAAATRSRQQRRWWLASVVRRRRHADRGGRLSRRGAKSLGLGLGMTSAHHGSRCGVRLLRAGAPHGVVVLRARGDSGRWAKAARVGRAGVAGRSGWMHRGGERDVRCGQETIARSLGMRSMSRGSPGLHADGRVLPRRWLTVLQPGFRRVRRVVAASDLWHGKRDVRWMIALVGLATRWVRL